MDIVEQFLVELAVLIGFRCILSAFLLVLVPRSYGRAVAVKGLICHRILIEL